MLAKLCNFRAAHFLLKSGRASRRVRSSPFDTLIGAICLTFRALSDAPISVANGHDLTLLPSSPTFEQKVCSPEISQFGKHNTQFLNVQEVLGEGLGGVGPLEPRGEVLSTPYFC